jgi:hypothetical protein
LAGSSFLGLAPGSAGRGTAAAAPPLGAGAAAPVTFCAEPDDGNAGSGGPEAAAAGCAAPAAGAAVVAVPPATVWKVKAGLEADLTTALACAGEATVVAPGVVAITAGAL